MHTLILLALSPFYVLTNEVGYVTEVQHTNNVRSVPATAIYLSNTDAARVAAGGCWTLTNGQYVATVNPRLQPTPQQFPTGIESPVLVLQTDDGKGVGVVADGLDLVVYLDHSSPRPSKEELAARVAAAKAERQSLRDVLKDIRVETTNNIADCVTISASTTNTANAAQGTQIKKLADELADANRQLNRLRKALLDYLRGTE
jgi:hypothetical protein